jgi:hypothetical protein
MRLPIPLVIFTRHQLNPIQLKDAKAVAFKDATHSELTEAADQPSFRVIDCQDLANRNLETSSDVIEVGNNLISKIKHCLSEYPVRMDGSAMHGYHELPSMIDLFGVLPPPLKDFLSYQYSHEQIPGPTIRVYEAWNVDRSKEGEKPTFEYKCWVKTQSFSCSEPSVVMAEELTPEQLEKLRGTGINLRCTITDFQSGTEEKDEVHAAIMVMSGQGFLIRRTVQFLRQRVEGIKAKLESEVV